MLAVCLTPMTDGHDVNNLLSVGDPIYHAPLADANAPQINGALELSHSRGPRITRKCRDVL